MLIPPGEYTMGSTPEQIKEWIDTYPGNEAQAVQARGEGPQHKVILTKPFYLGKHEVTQQQYEQIMGVNPSQYHPKSSTEVTRAKVAGKDTSNFPVDSVSWTDATQFCAKLSKAANQTGTYRLPTESEWEFACRAGSTTSYWWGDDRQKVVENENFGDATREVGSMRPNPFGLYDINGNVSEWASDWYNADEFQKFTSQAASDPQGAGDGSVRVLRGGSWGVNPALLGQSSLRYSERPGAQGAGYGFRVALPIESMQGVASTALNLMPELKVLAGSKGVQMMDGTLEAVGSNVGDGWTYRFDKHRGRDMVLSGEVKHLSGDHTWIGLRTAGEHRYYVAFKSNNQLAIGVRKSPTDIRNQIYPYQPSGEFVRFSFSVIGNRLSLSVNGKPVVHKFEAVDQLSEGVPMIGVWDGRGQFRNLSLELLDDIAAIGDAPPAAVAPFDSNQAKAHQAAWAKHLGVPVEFTNDLGMTFQLIPPGEFLQGSTPAQIQAWADFYPKDNQDAQDRARGEGPQHLTRLTRPFYLGMHEVTQQQYEQIMGENPAKFNTAAMEKDTSKFPIDSMSWDHAAAFLAKLNQRQPQAGPYRLPTEAEWEFACRAGTTTPYWFGDTSDGVAAAENFGPATQAVGALRANPFGLFDMGGNVREWVSDWWSRDEFQQFASQPAVDPPGATDGKWRVVRGGSWGVDPVLQAQASLRTYDRPAGANAGYGFRLVLPIEAASKVAASSTPGATTDAEGATILSGHGSDVYGVAAHPDGRHVVSVGWDGTARGWDTTTGREIMQVKLGAGTNCFSVAISPNGQLVAVGGTQGEINVYEFPSGKLVHSFDGDGKMIQAVAFTADGQGLFSGSVDTSLLWWDLKTGKQRKSFQGNGSGVTSLAVTPDGREVLSGGGDGIIRVGTLKSAKLRTEFTGHTGAVLGLAINPEGNLVASGGTDKSVRVRKLNGKKNEKELHVLQGHTHSVAGVAFLADGKHLVSGGFDKQLILWDLETGKAEKQWAAHSSSELGVRSVAVMPGSDMIVSGGFDGKVRLWKTDGLD